MKCQNNEPQKNYMFLLSKIIPEVIFHHNLSCWDQLQLEPDSSAGANHHNKLHHSLSKQAQPLASQYGMLYLTPVASDEDQNAFPVS